MEFECVGEKENLVLFKKEGIGVEFKGMKRSCINKLKIFNV